MSEQPSIATQFPGFRNFTLYDMLITYNGHKRLLNNPNNQSPEYYRNCLKIFKTEHPYGYLLEQLSNQDCGKEEIEQMEKMYKPHMSPEEL